MILAGFETTLLETKYILSKMLFLPLLPNFFCPPKECCFFFFKFDGQVMVKGANKGLKKDLGQAMVNE